MNALIAALGLVEAERFLMSVSRERFNYTEWRRHGLPDLPLDELARLAIKFYPKPTSPCRGHYE